MKQKNAVSIWAYDFDLTWKKKMFELGEITGIVMFFLSLFLLCCEHWWKKMTTDDMVRWLFQNLKNNKHEKLKKKILYFISWKKELKSILSRYMRRVLRSVWVRIVFVHDGKTNDGTGKNRGTWYIPQFAYWIYTKNHQH